MHIAAVCCTYKRPEHLGRMLWCFLRQTWRDAELVILDDAGQYPDQTGDRWQLISVPRRFRTLGEKRNAAVSLAGSGADAYAIWDDDDLYLPWALEASVAALEAAPWSRPSVVLFDDGSEALGRQATDGFWHASWAFRREAFEAAGGYPWMGSGEDQGFGKRLREAGIAEADPIASGFSPFFVWGCTDEVQHISGLGPDGYEVLGRQPLEPVDELRIEPPPLHARLPDLFEVRASRGL